MKNFRFALTALLGSALLCNACAISELKPEPVPLKVSDSANFTVDSSAIADKFSICGKDVVEFKASLRNGFNYAANLGDNATVVNANKAQSLLTIRSLDLSCLGNDKFDGFIINGDASVSWKVANGPETIYKLKLYGGAGSVEKALDQLISQLYNASFSTYMMNQVNEKK